MGRTNAERSGSTGVSSGPRVELVASSNARRGAEVLTGRLAVGLADEGLVTKGVGLTAGVGPVVEDLRSITEVPAGSAGRLSLQLIQALRREVNNWSPDVLFAGGGESLRYTVLASGRIPVVYMAVGEPSYWLRGRQARLINRGLLRRCAAVVAVCQRTKDQLVELEPTIASTTHVVYPGVPDGFESIHREASRGTLRVLFLGSLSSEKDPMLALRSIAGYEGAHARFVGSGPLARALESESRRLGLDDRVSFVGSVENVRPHLEWADVLLLTSRTEGMPGVVLEAAATALPTVGVDVGGVGEAISNGVTGLVTERDQSGISHALAAMDADRVGMVEMGIAARRRVESEFRFEETVSRIATILRSLE